MFVEPLRDVVFGPVRPALFLLLAGVTLVLLTACVNLANLLLARGASRASEVGLRTALGASRFRMARQFLIENLVLALIAGVAGVAGAFVGLRLILGIAPPDLPRVAAVAIDTRVLAATLAVALAVGLVSGMVPTWQARRLKLAGDWRGERNGTPGRSHARAGGALIVAEVALTVVLLVTGGLLARSFWHLRHVDPGFRSGGLIEAEYQLPPSRYPADFRAGPTSARCTPSPVACCGEHRPCQVSMPWRWQGSTRWTLASPTRSSSSAARRRPGTGRKCRSAV